MVREDISRFTKIPALLTERLILRRLLPSDVEDVFAYASDPDVSKYLLWSPHPSIEYTRHYLSHVDKRYKRGEFYDWGIEYQGKVIGTCGFTSFDIDNNAAQIGYVLGSAFWGKNIAYEAAMAVIAFGFDTLGLRRIYAKYMIGNQRSKRVMEKCNMHFEGVFRDGVYAKGVYRDVGVCAITLPEYYETKNC